MPISIPAVPSPRSATIATPTCDVAIAGAGPGGLTAALALRQAGFTVTICERAAQLDPIGAGIQISPNATRVLDSLGLGERLRTLAIAPEGIVLRSHTGRRLARVPLGDLVERRHGAPFLVIHRADLQRLLVDAVSSAEIPIRLDAPVTDFSEEAGSITLPSGLQVRVLVGADGIRSTVRERLLGDGSPAASGLVAWRSLASPIASRETGLWLGPKAHLVHYPVRQGTKLNFVAVTPDDRSPEQAFANWCPEARALLETAEEWQPWPLFHRLDPPARGRGQVTLLGDAFHPLLPFLAQGGALAIEDAVVLAACLKRTPDDPASALRAYESERAPRRARAAMLSRQQGAVYHAAGLFGRARDMALAVAPPTRLLARQDWLFRWRP